MYMFNSAERRVLLQQTQVLSKYLVEAAGSLRGDLFTLALVNFIKRTAPSNMENLEAMTINNPKDVKELETLLTNALEIVVKVATEEVEYSKVYTTGQLAKLFGVSITTIHNWIKEGRFVGIEPTARNKQTKIPESARWRAPNGDQVPIHMIAEKFAPPQPTATKLQEVTELTDAIAYYERKYGCSYEEFLQHHDLEQADYEMTRDAREWRYLVQRIGD